MLYPYMRVTDPVTSLYLGVSICYILVLVCQNPISIDINIHTILPGEKHQHLKKYNEILNMLILLPFCFVNFFEHNRWNRHLGTAAYQIWNTESDD